MSGKSLRTEEANSSIKRHRREIADALVGDIQGIAIYEIQCGKKTKRRFQFLAGITGNEEEKIEKARRRAEREMRPEERIVKIYWLKDILLP
ncbi:MAG: hypothetical protein Q7T50_01925 [Candidatus Magasanikbacteria bacterium]|nr:hypothetical protein [Candidatus Magasanikbacteria bacterium]